MLRALARNGEPSNEIDNRGCVVIGGTTKGPYLSCHSNDSEQTDHDDVAPGRPSCRIRGYVAAQANSQDPDLIFRESTTFKLLTPNDKLAVYGIDDPIVQGIACHYTVPEKGGLSGALGLAEQTSDISLACRQYGPIKFKDKFSQGDVVFSERRSLSSRRCRSSGVAIQSGIYLCI